MILNIFEEIILKPLHLKINSLEKDVECDDYFGYNLHVNQTNIKFRKAKITPKKVGQFVTLWQRNNENQTEPFSVNNQFKLYIIAVEDADKRGFFIFSKEILAEKNILSTEKKEGKRGFRVYPDWVIPTNKQAEKTKNWQTDYFIEITENNQVDFIKLEKLFN
ncbi:MepB protein [Algoriella xinjiangensis]|uniref:MepB family protein n=1 Tax=Algoriella xinjiangensis TaxID=684065 RepID=UPI000F9E136A|nr:MepB family protein [Algoriella xinjiangensis]VDH17459.1 MepB protein [Algoriella xinjiangensis]